MSTVSPITCFPPVGTTRQPRRLRALLTAAVLSVLVGGAIAFSQVVAGGQRTEMVSPDHGQAIQVADGEDVSSDIVEPEATQEAATEIENTADDAHGVVAATLESGVGTTEIGQPASMRPAPSTRFEMASVITPTVITSSVSSSPTPTATPSPSPTPITVRTPAVFTYTVASGDTISAIAAKFSVSAQTIMRANGLDEGGVLPVGKGLTILPISGVLHTVAAGENVLSLAERYRVIPEEIAAANGLAEPYSIYVGERLIVPQSLQLEQPDEDTRAATPIVRAKQEYDVVAGDSLAAIATRHGVSIEALAAANGLDLAKALPVGQHLTIPASGALEHVVKTGDTVTSIAAQYSASAIDIIKANKLVEPFMVALGQTILVPGVEFGGVARVSGPAAPTSTPTRAPTIQPSPTATPNPTFTPSRAATPSPTVTAIAKGSPDGGSIYQVVAGDTLSAIAGRHGRTVDALVKANNLDVAKPLMVGQRLQIPAAGGVVTSVAAPTLAATATATRIATVTLSPSPTRPATATPAVAPTRTPTPTPPPSAAVSQPTSDRAGLRTKAVEIAMKYLGARYTWGGASPATGFDCSGFVMYVYRQAGMALPRDLWGQLNSGAKVDRNALKAGDILFFQNTYKPGLSHSGIYLGDGRFIHAASENTGVIITPLDNKYWSAHYLGATRPD